MHRNLSGSLLSFLTCLSNTIMLSLLFFGSLFSKNWRIQIFSKKIIQGRNVQSFRCLYSKKNNKIIEWQQRTGWWGGSLYNKIIRARWPHIQMQGGTGPLGVTAMQLEVGLTSLRIIRMARSQKSSQATSADVCCFFSPTLPLLPLFSLFQSFGCCLQNQF